jgi:hypothetical protein
MNYYDKYTNKAELFRFLKDNRGTLIAQKKYDMKRADVVSFHALSFSDKGENTAKAASGDTESLLAKEVIKVRSIINTTNLLDSHKDVHIPGLWNKSLKEQRNLCLLQEHQYSFDHIIASGVKAHAMKMTWKELGFDFDGQTEALVFDSEIEKTRNPYMFDQYARGYVNNHSVGMRYVQLFLCVNSEDKYYIEEKENWDKYIGEVINAGEAEESGFFWAVTEAKVVEGSAVPLGSNWATPTQSVKEISEPSEDTRQYKEPSEDTPGAMFSKFINLIGN